MWANFETFFATEYHDLEEEEKPTVKGQGYHSTNLVQEKREQDDYLLAESLQHLAIAATTDN